MELDRDLVHVIACNLDQPQTVLDALRATLSPAEAAVRARLRRARDRERAVASRGVLRVLLGACTGVEPAHVRIVEGPNGKPELAPPEPHDLRFNVSHAGRFALYAIASGRQVGIDVEPAGRTVAEPAAFARELGLPCTARGRELLTRWTRHEALAKATGEGLDAPTPDGTVQWRAVTLDWGGHHVAGLVVEGSGWRLRAGQAHSMTAVPVVVASIVELPIESSTMLVRVPAAAVSSRTLPRQESTAPLRSMPR